MFSLFREFRVNYPFRDADDLTKTRLHLVEVFGLMRTTTVAVGTTHG